MEFTASQIADYLQGSIVGDEWATVTTVAEIENAKSGSLAFLSNPKYTPYIYDTQASIVLVNDTFIPEKEVKATLIKVPDAYASFARLLDLYTQFQKKKEGIHETAIIPATATLGENVYLGEYVVLGENVTLGDNVKIYPNTYIGDGVSIGNDTTIYSGSNIYSETKIGTHCIIHSGTVIGSDGFGFAPRNDGTFEKIAQIGNVEIEDYVEIGSNCSIDRATLGTTWIRKGAKLDNLLQVAHNVEIGENTVIAAQTGISGSTKIGKNCMVGGQAGIVGHIQIADGVKIQAQSGVGKSINKPGVSIQGSPAFDYSQFNRSFVIFKNLEKLEKRVRELEAKLKEVESL
jgi:UDP-3-O-[3-hydroxymyristoyl] glucosamine N-acyltransferase